MKILMSAYSCDPTRGGEPGNGWHWALRTAKQGHEVWCLTNTNGKKNIEKTLEQEPCSNLHFVFVPIPGWLQKISKTQLVVYWRYLSWQSEAYKAAAKLDKEVNFDIVHHVTWGSISLGSELWKLNKPFIFGPIGGGQSAPTPFKKYLHQWWKNELVRRFTNSVLTVFPNVTHTMRKAKNVLVTNSETYKMAQNLGATNLTYFVDTGLPDNFAPKILPQKSPSKELRILWVGRLYAVKGISLALEALAQVSKDVPFKLTILGDGPLNKLVAKLIKEYNLEEKVDWKGQVPWDQVREAYLSHDVFLFCSLRESFGSQLLEAMASGLPIITLNHQGAGAFVPEDAGIKVSVDTPAQTIKELTQAVEYMYLHPEKRSEFGFSGLQFAASETWSMRIARTTKMYKEITNEELVHEL